MSQFLRHETPHAFRTRVRRHDVVEERAEELSAKTIITFRSMSAWTNYLWLHSCDVAYAIKELPQDGRA